MRHEKRLSPSLLALLVPLLVLPSMALVFWLAVKVVGREAGYLLGFGIYWLFWCLLLPRLFLGKAGFASLLTDRSPLFSRRNLPVMLLWCAVTLVAVWMYGLVWRRAPLALILAAIPLATVNGVCEEVLWRGLFVRLCPQNPWLGIIYPSAGFALWHFAPQIAMPDANAAGFVVSTLFLGLAYGLIAYRTGSAKWTAISHSLNGAIALADPLAWLVLLFISL